MYEFSCSWPSIVPSSWIREWIRFFLCLPLAILWKYLVFESPSSINWDLECWYHLSSSSSRSFVVSTFDWILSRISCAVSGRTSVQASRSSIDESRWFYFLNKPFVWRANPESYLRTECIFLFHLTIGDSSRTCLSQKFLTISWKLSRYNQPSNQRVDGESILILKP